MRKEERVAACCPLLLLGERDSPFRARAGIAGGAFIAALRTVTGHDPVTASDPACNDIVI